MIGYALKNAEQVGVGIDVMQPAGGHQALDDGDMPGTNFAPAKQPVLPVMQMVYASGSARIARPHSALACSPEL